ncbi:MAG: 2-succinyl-5-enolpyruvyl-6-hydroxy-3-cyclohexene-1-carboxylic-acid synthase [Bacteriovoracales bacterium]|nr:2-succinyl-5-enolpyruvyl-6-hydroxy-3-cyclohexene-1-carboxylic-acid synthase [Bacteriovoracales bacterium]
MEGNGREDEAFFVNVSLLQFQNSYRLVVSLERLGVGVGLLSPGLRCAPLYLALKKSSLPLHSVIDERALAFEALGWCRTQKRPPLLACTSGTAPAHFYPAVIEAYQSRLPLVILSCDRPVRLRGSDSAQTIDQEHLYGRYSCFDQSLELYKNIPVEEIASLAFKAMTKEQRPIHLNLSYEAPSLQTLPEVSSLPLPEVLALPPLQKRRKKVTALRPSLLSRLKDLKRPLIVIGEESRALPHAPLIPWLKGLDVPFFADITSGIKIQTIHFPQSVSSLDSPFVLDSIKEEIDGIVQLGGAVVSQNYERLLDDFEGPKVIHLAHDFADRILEKRILAHQRVESWITETWPQWTFPHNPLQEYESKRRRIFSLYPFEDPTHYHVVKEIHRHIGEKDILLIGNSTPIRSFNDYVYPSPKSFSLQFQMGARGIDGLISQALGAAKAHSGRVICVLGDIGTLHDFSSLVGPLPENLKVLILNNRRGGLFSRVPLGQNRKLLEDVIETPHALSFKELCGSWPHFAHGASSIASFLEGEGRIWEFPIDHEKDLQEWRKLI